MSDLTDAKCQLYSALLQEMKLSREDQQLLRLLQEDPTVRERRLSGRERTREGVDVQPTDLGRDRAE